MPRTLLSRGSPPAVHWAASFAQILPCGCFCKPPFLALGWVWMEALHFLKVGGWVGDAAQLPFARGWEICKVQRWCDPKPAENTSPLVEFDNYHNAINVALSENTDS